MRRRILLHLLLFAFSVGSFLAHSQVTGDKPTAIRNPSGSPCTYTLSSNGQAFSQAGGSGSFSASAPMGCPWSITSNAAWLTVTSGPSGPVSATFFYSAAPNSSPTINQSASLTISGAVTFEVSENYVPVSAALNFVPVTPCRIIDTRNAPGGYLRAFSTWNADILGSPCGIPSTASAYSLNVMVAPLRVLYYLTVWPTGESQPLASTLNDDNRLKVVAAIVSTGTNGEVSFYPTQDTDLTLDINGYFVPASANVGLEFYPMLPCRVADTRTANGPFGGPSFGYASSRDFSILQSACAVPSVAQGYLLNLTTVPVPVSNYFDFHAYLSAWATGPNQPLIATFATVYSDPEEVTANASLIPAGVGGAVSVYVTNPTDLVIDISGYFAPPGPSGLHLYTVAPCRAFDTRVSGTLQPLTGIIQVPLANTCGIPSTASAVVLNATVQPESDLGFLTLWAEGNNLPLASNLNADDGAITSNMAVVSLGSSGAIDVYASSSTHLMLDISGYFAQ